MPIEGLHTEVSSDVPKRYGLVSSSTNERIGEGLELYRIDRVHVPSEGESTLGHVQIPQLDVVVHGATEQEVP